jgi:threonine/homoserine efflux transporter RhtA
LEFDPLGYVMGLTSCMLQAAYMICVEKTGAEKGTSSVELMVYNALLSAPPLLAMVACTVGAVYTLNPGVTHSFESARFQPLNL